jgi:hypothetical protein
METVLEFQFRDTPLSPVFVTLGDDGLEIRSSSSHSSNLEIPSDADLFKYFLNEEELDASTSSESGSPQYDSLNSSPPPIPSPPEFSESSLDHFNPITIKLEKGSDNVARKRKIKDGELFPSPFPN